MKLISFFIIFILAISSLQAVIAEGSDCVTNNQKNFVILIDVSGSTAANEGQTLSNEKKYAIDLLDNLPYNSKIGIIAFASMPNKLYELTALNQISVEYMKNEISRTSIDTTKSSGIGGGTKIGAALNSAIAMIKNNYAQGGNEIFLFSDGANQDRNYAVESAKLSATKGIRISSLFIPRMNQFSSASHDEEYMKYYSDISNGTFGTEINSWIGEIKTRVFETKPLCEGIISEENITNTTKEINITPDNITIQVNEVLAKYNASQNLSAQVVELPPKNAFVEFMTGMPGRITAVVIGLILIISSFIMYRKAHHAHRHEPVN